jgi:recombination DNA repair RAD52 pathway protein
LEAFLLQSTYIEASLKKLIDDDIGFNIEMPVIRNNTKNPELYWKIIKRTSTIRKKLLRQNMSEIIDYLHRVETIDETLKKKLHSYRKKRNSILHDLVSNTSNPQFEKNIEDLVTDGQRILNNSAMIDASNSIQTDEELDEIIKSDDPEAVNKFYKAQQNENPSNDKVTLST